MTRQGFITTGFLALLFFSGLAQARLTAAESPHRWPQWGGPHRDFKVECGALAESWPESGPLRLWDRALGDGYSSVIVEGKRLFTQYRPETRTPHEYVVCLDADTGRTVWKHRVEADLPDVVDDSGWGGHGPNSTPLVTGDRVYAVGSRAILTCLEKTTGKPLWTHDLKASYGAVYAPGDGYSPSPIAYGGNLIVPINRIRSRGAPPEDRFALVAFDLVTGTLAWHDQDSEVRFSSPIIVSFEGRDQLVFPTYSDLLSMDPRTGELLWRIPVKGSIVTPVWNGVDTLFFSSGGTDAVGVGVRLYMKDGRPAAEQRWLNEDDVLIWQPTPVVLGDHLYGCDQKNLVCVEIATGRCVWSKEGFPLATCVHGDGKLVLLDEDGRLSLTRVSPEGVTLLARCKVAEKYAFTAPTLAGTRLYVRDRKRIMALELGK